MKREHRLIVALDLPDGEEALSMARVTAPFCDAFKVNVPLVLSAGMGIVDRLAEHGNVVCDFKVADIPATNRRIVEAVFDHGASGVIVHGFPGEDSLDACLQVARGDVFVLAHMSHPGADRFFSAASEEIAAMARDRGASGVVVGATRPREIARMREIVDDLLILTPGVGTQGGDPGEALRHGADHLIVGRTITTAPDPVEAAKGLLRAIHDAGESL